MSEYMWGREGDLQLTGKGKKLIKIKREEIVDTYNRERESREL